MVDNARLDLLARQDDESIYRVMLRIAGLDLVNSPLALALY